LNTEMWKFKSSHKEESRASSADSSKACWKSRAHIYYYIRRSKNSTCEKYRKGYALIADKAPIAGVGK